MPWKHYLSDFARHSPTVRLFTGATAWLCGRATRDTVERARRLARAMEFTQSPWLTENIRHSIAQAPGFDDPETWLQILRSNPRYAQIMQADPALSRSILLKPPGVNGEKGILLMTFEYNWARLICGLDAESFAWLADRYDFVLSTSWSATDYAALAAFLGRTTGTVYVQSCNYSEIAVIEAFHPRLRCLPTLPCDWINPHLYDQSHTAERPVDFIMVANWGEFKRHWDFFQALAQMPAGLRVVLIGQREPSRSQETIRNLAKAYRVPQQLEIYESIPIAKVAELQSQAKVSVIMSRREGCCVAAVESLFAGCALAMREDAHVGPLAYINESTGRRLRPGNIAEDLMQLLKEASAMQPQHWAATHLANQVSHDKVNTFLKQQALALNQPWTQDIILPQWRPHPTYASTEGKECVRPAFDELHSRFPRLFPAHLLDESWK